MVMALGYHASAQLVAEAGYSLARAMHARVALLHIISDPVYYSFLNYSPIMGFDGYNSIDTIQPEVSDELEGRAQRFLLASKKFLGDESIETMVAWGEVGVAILETAKAIHADIIVMGNHGRQGLNRMLLGSVTEYVLHHSTIPLLIIPTKYS